MSGLANVNSTAAGSAPQTATRAIFFSAGFCMASWAPLIPFVKSRLHLSDGKLGLLLLCLGSGSVLAMPIAGVLAGRFGCRVMITIAALFTCCMLPLLATLSHVAAVAAALFCFGSAIGTLDVVMNIHAVIVERRSGRAIMSGFHGLYSVGGFAGAGMTSLLISNGFALLSTSLTSVAVIVMLVVFSFRSLLPYGADQGTGGLADGEQRNPVFVFPHGQVLLLGSFCFVLFLAEGSVLDWSAVFLSTVRRIDARKAGLGYVAFATAMTVCRLTGDSMVRTVGRAKVVLFGALCAAGGFLIAAIAASPVLGIVGFGLVGVGASNAVPIMFSAAGRQTAMLTNHAIAAITTLGYGGILMGPAIVGLLANYFGLAIGLSFVAIMLIAVAIRSTRVNF